jgi:hypothetical protein
MPETAPNPKWLLARWSGLAWLETVVKLAALSCAMVALIRTSGTTPSFPSDLALVQWITLLVLALGLLVAIYDRLLEREIGAMVFVIINILGHWGMLFALTRQPGPGWLLPLFAGLMLLGDLVKLIFLRTSDFRVRDTPKSVLYGLTAIYAAGYGLILLLGWLR